MGNGGRWMNASGYQTTHTPTEHSALSFRPGQAGADPTYGPHRLCGTSQIRWLHPYL